ncbi:MAG: hypothetical protein ACYTGH_21540 [Planctomycetota bacterium]|jgi:hypothetical protein
MTAAATKLMGIDFIDDLEKRLDRQDAFWDCEILDRPVISVQAPCPNPDYPAPAAKGYEVLRDRWMDGEQMALNHVHRVHNTAFLGDAIPEAFPNLGPEVFSAFFDMEMEYGESTSWSTPNLKDWADMDSIQFNEENFYWKKILEMTDTFLEIGKGHFYTGVTDLHPGGDAIAAFRDPMEFNIDMIEHPEEVKILIDRVTQVFEKVYNLYTDKLQAAGQAIASWPGIVSRKRWYVPSNDFSCMISKEMFDNIFLPGIAEECRMLEASIYHLDGPDALKHLDSLLEIPELNAIQWVYGSGNGCCLDWLDVYRACQAAGKGLQIFAAAEEIDTLMKELKPEGVWLGTYAPDVESAKAIIEKVKSWTR